MQRLKALVESQRFEQAIVTLIIINAISLGLETSPAVMAEAGGLIVAVDRLILSVFVIELLAKFVVYRAGFFRSPWRIFDLFVVGIALIPSAGAFAVLRALRILRVLRLVSVVPSLRRVIGGLLNALPGIHHQQGAFAGIERPGNLVGKIHMARGVDEVQLVLLTVTGFVIQRDTLGLDGNPSLTFEIHGVQDLLGHFTVGQATADLYETVCQRGFAMVNVGDDGKVTDSAQFSHRR